MGGSEVRVARSFWSEVYKVELGGRTLVKKAFRRGWPVRALCRLFGTRGYTSDGMIELVYHKRRMAHRLSKFYNFRHFIVDALGTCPGGLYLPFVEGRHPRTDEELTFVRDFLEGLEEFFDGIGMPTWSFGRYYSDPTWRLRRKNVLISPDGIRIVDYEEVVLVFGGRRPRLEFDGVDLKLLRRFLEREAGELERRIGSDKLEELLYSTGRYEELREVVG